MGRVGIGQQADELEAYLDIETTGLDVVQCEITVVGIYLSGPAQDRCVQLVGHRINADAILDTLADIRCLYTYNGSRFDLPFIHARHGVNLESHFGHCDLMFNCWRHNLYGGLKGVERCLGIERRLKEVNGLEAIRLWWRYINDYDENALKTLLAYNQEDVVNLKVLKEKLLETEYPE
jgi:uncharacterized protein YprB with RNaseH-like and TPR domain